MFTAIKSWLHRLFGKTEEKAVQPVRTKKKLSRADRKQIEAAIARANRTDKKEKSAQDSIPYERMWPDGICRVSDGHYTKTIQFQDINYQLSQNEDKTAIFEGWCDFLNYFDSSIKFELSFLNLAASKETFAHAISIPLQGDDFDSIRVEYMTMLQNQLAKGNNGLIKTKYLTFGIDADSIKSAKPRLERMSIENQHLALNEFVSSMPESANAEVLEFIDNGYSGTNFERPKVQELIEMVRANKIDCIIVKDFSRFGRNSIETGYFIERVFPLFHTRFISINDNFDSDQHKGDTGGMDVAFKYLISEYYSRDMSIKTKSAKYAKMQRGEYQSKVCPYGYRKSADGRMEPNPETAAVVQLIFQLAATGIGAAAVTRELFKRGIPTPGEYKATHGQQYHDVSRSRGRWSSSTVLRILEDERYIGSYVIGRRAVIEVGGTRSRRKDRDKWFIIPDHHPAIVDKELFEKVQAVQRRFSLPTRKTREYPLKSKVYCGCCDHALSRIVQKRPFYMCRHSTADVNSRCRDVRADAAGLEEAVLFTLKKQLEILLPVHEDGTIHLEATAAKCSEYEKQLEALKDQKQALFERYLLGQIELDTYKSEKAVYDAEILKVKNAYAAVTAQAKLKREEQARQSSRQEIVHSIAEADVLTSELTDLLIEKVYVFPDNRIEIVYKVHDLFE